MYALLNDLVVSHQPGIKSFKEISNVWWAHFEPNRSVIAERFHFHKHNQAPRKSITELDKALHKLVTRCQFGTNLTEALTDHFVCGLLHDNIQRHLLSEADLMYHKAMDIAEGMQAANANSKAFKTSKLILNKLDRCIPSLGIRALVTTVGALATSPLTGSSRMQYMSCMQEGRPYLTSVSLREAVMTRVHISTM